MAKPSSQAADAVVTEQTFESALDRLGTIVERLEEGDLPLEESLSLFEEGIRLSRASQAKLDAAEKKVEKLLAVDADGRARTEPFAVRAEDED
jgi:exodeoxyribonuclease VII small subunit